MKAAIVGAGFIGSTHAGALKSVPEISVKWIMDKNRSRAQKLAKIHKAKWTTEIADILGDDETQIVIHALPTPYRLQFLKKYVNAGKHIFCEKPLALDKKEANKILSLSKAYKKTFMTGHVVRFFWEYVKTRSLIREGKIGKPGIVRLSRCSGIPKSFDKKDNWYMDPTKSGGVLLDLAIHDLDWLLWTFGPVKRGFSQVSLTRKKTPQYALAILKFKNDVLAHVEASWTEAPGTFYTSFEISGSGGFLEFDMRTNNTLLFSPKIKTGKKAAGTSIPESPTMESPYVTQMKHFAGCIEKGTKPLAGAKEAFRAQNLCLDLVKSARINKPVAY